MRRSRTPLPKRSLSFSPRPASVTPELRPDEGALKAILAAGAEKARTIAVGALAEVRDRMGFGPA